jgi:hypothetical protein
VIAFARIAALALGLLDDDAAAAVEEHVAGCDGCAARLERLLALGDEVAALARAGGAPLTFGRPFLARLEAARLVTRRYRVANGGAVACTVDADDIYSTMRFALDARGFGRLDLVWESLWGLVRFADVPFDSDGVVAVMPATALRPFPTHRMVARLFAVDERGERQVGEYTLDHTGYVARG